jgi:hypothetical protein
LGRHRDGSPARDPPDSVGDV